MTTSHSHPVLAPNSHPEAEPSAASLPVIFAFSNVVGGGDGIAYAIAEDGTILGSHWCSHECYVPGDLGVTEGYRPDRHVTYAEHYPGGYTMEFVPARDVTSHAGLAVALALNQKASEAAEAARAAELGAMLAALQTN